MATSGDLDLRARAQRLTTRDVDQPLPEAITFLLDGWHILTADWRAPDHGTLNVITAYRPPSPHQDQCWVSIGFLHSAASWLQAAPAPRRIMINTAVNTNTLTTGTLTDHLEAMVHRSPRLGSPWLISAMNVLNTPKPDVPSLDTEVAATRTLFGLGWNPALARQLLAVI